MILIILMICCLVTIVGIIKGTTSGLVGLFASGISLAVFGFQYQMFRIYDHIDSSISPYKRVDEEKIIENGQIIGERRYYRNGWITPFVMSRDFFTK